MKLKWLGISIISGLSINTVCSAQNVINPAFLSNSNSSQQTTSNNQKSSSTTQTSSSPTISSTQQQQTARPTSQKTQYLEKQTTPSNTQTTTATSTNSTTNTEETNTTTNANANPTGISNPTITIKNNTPHLAWILVAPVKSQTYNAFNAISLNGNSQAVVQTPTSLFATQMALKDGTDNEIDCANLAGNASYVITLTYNNKKKAICKVEKLNSGSSN